MMRLRGRDVERGEIVVALRALRGIERSAGREDTGDFAAHDLLRELGVFHLLADGDAVALLQQAADVALYGVVGDAAMGTWRSRSRAVRVISSSRAAVFASS